MTASIFSAYGRAASAAFCARRSFEAATICIALVIFCVALVEAMRTRMSLSDAMSFGLSPGHGALPPPLRGRLGEGGSHDRRSLGLTPLPNPPPQGGRGQVSACGHDHAPQHSSSERLRVALDHALQFRGG